MDPLSLIRLHLELECIGVDHENQLVCIPCAEPDTLHRVYATRFVGGTHIFFRHDLPVNIRTALLALPFDAYFQFPQQIMRVLAANGPCEETYIGKSYIFPAGLNHTHFPQALPLSQVDPDIIRRYNPDMNPGAKEIYGVLVDGQIVSTCESSRENEAAGEAWVHTLEGFRGRGYARQAAAAWGFHLMRKGKIPFYSHKVENLASQAVACALGLIQYVEDAGYA